MLGHFPLCVHPVSRKQQASYEKGSSRSIYRTPKVASASTIHDPIKKTSYVNLSRIDLFNEHRYAPVPTIDTATNQFVIATTSYFRRSTLRLTREWPRESFVRSPADDAATENLIPKFSVAALSGPESLRLHAAWPLSALPAAPPLHCLEWPLEDVSCPTCQE